MEYQNQENLIAIMHESKTLQKLIFDKSQNIKKNIKNDSNSSSYDIYLSLDQTLQSIELLQQNILTKNPTLFTEEKKIYTEEKRSTITMTIKDNVDEEKYSITETIQETRIPIPQTTEPINIIKETPKNYPKETHEFESLDDCTEYAPFIYSDPIRFNMGANKEDEFMMHKLRKGYFILHGDKLLPDLYTVNLVLNVIDGFIYVLPDAGFDMYKQPYPLLYNGKYYKWNKTHFDANRQLYYFIE